MSRRTPYGVRFLIAELPVMVVHTGRDSLLRDAVVFPHCRMAVLLSASVWTKNAVDINCETRIGSVLVTKMVKHV